MTVFEKYLATKPHITQTKPVNTSGMSEDEKDLRHKQWLSKRLNGIGASEVKSVFDWDEYKPAYNLFWDKINPAPQENFENMFMFTGTQLEETIIKWCRYFDKTEEIMMQNYHARKIVTNIETGIGTIHNTKYPWLYVSPDGIVNRKDHEGLGTGEVKKLSRWQREKWIGNIPQTHLLQLWTQMVVLELEYGDLMMFTDGVHIDVHTFEYNKVICNEIIERTGDFWHNRILPARKLLTGIYEAERTYNMMLARELRDGLQYLEPEITGYEATTDLLKAKYINRAIDPNACTIKGNDTDLAGAKEYARIREEMKKLKAAQILEQNKLLRKMEGMKRISFDAAGYVSHENNRFSVKLK